MSFEFTETIMNEDGEFETSVIKEIGGFLNRHPDIHHADKWDPIDDTPHVNSFFHQDEEFQAYRSGVFQYLEGGK